MRVDGEIEALRELFARSARRLARIPLRVQLVGAEPAAELALTC